MTRWRECSRTAAEALSYDSTLYKTAAVVAAAVAAALVAWFVSTRILRIGGPADSGLAVEAI